MRWRWRTVDFDAEIPEPSAHTGELTVFGSPPRLMSDIEGVERRDAVPCNRRGVQLGLGRRAEISNRRVQDARALRPVA